MKKVIVQISDKSGVRLERVNLGTAGVSIGRAWNNNVILQDKYVDPDHLQLSLGEGGIVMIADLATTNGSVLSGRSLSGEAKPYRLGDPIKIGDTTLQIFDQTAGVAPTAMRSGWYLLSEKFTGFRSLALLTALTLVISVFADWFNATEPVKTKDVVMMIFSGLIYLLVWSIVLGVFSKIVSGRSNVRSLWVLGCIAITMLNLVSLLIVFLRFNIQNGEIGYWLAAGGFGALTIWILYGVFTYTTHFSERPKWVLAILLVVIGWGLVEGDDLVKEDHEKWSSQTHTEEVTLPPAFLLRDAVSVDEYQQDTDQLFEFDLQN